MKNKKITRKISQGMYILTTKNGGCVVDAVSQISAGDYPDVVAKFLVNGILNNTKNNTKIEWLTTKKAAWRFMTAGFNKRNFFK